MQRRSVIWFVIAGLLVAFALAFFVSPEASSEPDGLNKVAIDRRFDALEQAPATSDSPLADYGVRGVDDERFSTGLAGIIGVAATFIAGTGALWLATRRARRPAAA
jgi:hypothetical protein